MSHSPPNKKMRYSLRSTSDLLHSAAVMCIGKYMGSIINMHAIHPYSNTRDATAMQGQDAINKQTFGPENLNSEKPEFITIPIPTLSEEREHVMFMERLFLDQGFFNKDEFKNVLQTGPGL